MPSTHEKAHHKKNSSQDMPFFRRMRKEAVTNLLRAGMHASQRGSADGVHFLQGVALTAVKACVPLRMRLARNMKAVGIYRRGLVDRHFERAADQLGFLMRIFQAGFPGSGVGKEWRFDESFQHLQDAYDAHRGVLIIAPHLCGYPVLPPVLTQRLPCSIYLRRSADPRKHEINKAIGQAGGGHLVYPPANATRAQRLNVALQILRERRMLYLTPDLLRKPDKGTPVTIFGRDVYFPTGVPIMAMRTGALVVMVFWHYHDGQYHIRFHEAMDFSGRGDRRRRAAECMSRFAKLMDECLREQPELWWNWLDKRWTWTLRGQMTYPTG